MSSSSQADKLRQAAAQGDADQVKALLEAGARIEPDLVSRLLITPVIMNSGFGCHL